MWWCLHFPTWTLFACRVLALVYQLQFANNIIWNRTLFFCEYGIAYLALKFEASIAFIVS